MTTAGSDSNAGIISISQESFSEEEMMVILEAVFRKIDVPRRKSEPAIKTIVLDLFGTAKAGKDAVTPHIERPFRRRKFNIFSPPETAEIEEIRNKSSDIPIIFQARHLTGIQDYVLNLAYDRNFHVVILHRGLIDELYWYEKGRREGQYSEEHVKSVRNLIFELLRLNLVDAYFFLSCSPEEALRREYAESLTQQRGSNMNEKALAESHDIYRMILEDVKKNVPGLPIFRIDTTNLKVKEATAEIMRYLLPTLCVRFDVPSSGFMPRSMTLLKKEAKRCARFEEQLKLRGHPSMERLAEAGWTRAYPAVTQEDTYLNPIPEQKDSDGFFDEIVRIRRKDNGTLKFIYKGESQDRIFSHRIPLQFEISNEDAEKILSIYPQILQLRKARQYFQLERQQSQSKEQPFTVHLDAIEGLGDFTEIRVLGSSEKTHAQDLLDLATELGFRPSDIVEGSYLALALAHQKK